VIDNKRRPFVVMILVRGTARNRRFQGDSEIGVAMKAGQSLLLHGFLHEPMPGQTIRGHRESRGRLHLRRLSALHPEADASLA